MSDGTDAPVQNTCSPRTRELDPINLTNVPGDLRSDVRNKVLAGHGLVCETRLEERTHRGRKTWFLIVTVDLNRFVNPDRIETQIDGVIEFANLQVARAKATPTPGFHGTVSRRSQQREQQFVNTTGRTSVR